MCRNSSSYGFSHTFYSENPETTANTVATDPAAAPADTATTTSTPQIDEALELAKRAFALKKYEQAVEHYATALELMYVSRRLRVSPCPTR